MPRKKSSAIVESAKAKKPVDVKKALNEAMGEKVLEQVEKLAENIDKAEDILEGVGDPETERGRGDTRDNMQKALDAIKGLPAMSAQISKVASHFGVDATELQAAHRARSSKRAHPTKATAHKLKSDETRPPSDHDSNIHFKNSSVNPDVAAVQNLTPAPAGNSPQGFPPIDLPPPAAVAPPAPAAAPAAPVAVEPEEPPKKKSFLELLFGRKK